MVFCHKEQARLEQGMYQILPEDWKQNYERHQELIFLFANPYPATIVYCITSFSLQSTFLCFPTPLHPK